MEKRTVDPWKWGEQTNSVQAVEIKQAEGTLYCSGQVAIDANGQPSTADMRAQLTQIFQNLEHLIKESGYDCSGIVRLNIVTTSMREFFTSCVDIYQGWIAQHGIKQATTMFEVQGLYAGLTVEVEATVVK
ncbi:RidA family protein [Hymenobacter terrenus]|uniref:RidA family protein n=1 Tax=Hymenobacter terrenus TaxID=1629124 RepID=UPI0006198826|nr:RidA family protein [Hymenobacter terrenus]